MQVSRCKVLPVTSMEKCHHQKVYVYHAVSLRDVLPVIAVEKISHQEYIYQAASNELN